MPIVYDRFQDGMFLGIGYYDYSVLWDFYVKVYYTLYYISFIIRYICYIISIYV